MINDVLTHVMWSCVAIGVPAIFLGGVVSDCNDPKVDLFVGAMVLLFIICVLVFWICGVAKIWC